MADAIPGGWLDQEEVSEIRSVLRIRANQLERRIREEQDLAQTFNAKGWEDARASQLALIAVNDERLQTIRRVLAVFDGIEHGARVDAMPSPEEEEAQERAFYGDAGQLPDARRFAALDDEALRREVSDALGREITPEEAQNVRATALAILEDGEVADAAAD